MRTTIRTSLLLLAISVSLAVHAADFATRTYPMSIDVEGQYFQSSIFLRLQVKDYNVPFEQFAKSASDPYETAFVSFIKALRDNDTVTAAKFLAPANRVAAGTANAQAKTEHAPADVVRGYRAGFAGMQDLVIVAQVLNGSKHLFIWESRAGASKIRRAFAVDGDADAIAVHEVTSADPVSVIIVNNVMEAMREAPAAYQSLAARSTKFEYSLPARGVAPVVMQFGGSVVDVAPAAMTAAAASASAATAEVLNAYAEMAESLRLHATDQFLAHFTPRSAKRMKQLIDAVPEAAYDGVYDLAWQKKNIRLIAGSEPVYVVFYTLGNSTDYKYDYLVRDLATSKLLFANVGRRSFADEVFSRPEFFDPARVVDRKSVTQ